MIKLRTLKEANISQGTKVLLRADFDVSVKNGKVQDEFRIREVLPTIKYILKRGGVVRIIAHRSRPGGRRIAALSLGPVALCLSRLIKRKVKLISDPLDEELYQKFRESRNILVFENIRFWRGEEDNSPIFSRALSRWGEIYVNDAFASSHRKHASLVLLPKILPSFAGLRLEEEIIRLSRVLYNPARPLFAIIGGAKLETKLPLIERFLRNGGEVLVGGVAANVMLALRGVRMKKSVSVSHPEIIRRVNKIILNPKLHLPLDLIVSRKVGARSRQDIIYGVKKDEIPFDVGPETVKYFTSLLLHARTIIWNGPLGLIEIAAFSKGTLYLARRLRRIRAFKVIGGGDTIAFLKRNKLLGGFNHISTGGGAMLEFLAGNKLPGIEVLRKSKFKNQNAR